MQIRTDFNGGNIKVIEMSADTVVMLPDLRDTNGEWFYWAFAVEGAENRTITFDFSGKHVLGYFGPAVSHDFETWKWARDFNEDDDTKFTYTFGADEKLVYFAHSMLYQVDRFDRLAKEISLSVSTLTKSEQGRDVQLVEFGDKGPLVMLASRNHCCESTGTYALEGVMREFSENPLLDYKVAVVPFMDIDGVVGGDQGKNRIPHDHNRDYTSEPIYSSVRGVMDYVKGKDVALGLDFHSPWHRGGTNDTCFVVRAGHIHQEGYNKFGNILEEVAGKNPDSFDYFTKNDIDFETSWNRGGSPTFAHFFDSMPSAHWGATLEVAYFGTKDNTVSQENLVELGRCVANAIRIYLGDSSKKE